MSRLEDGLSTEDEMALPVFAATSFSDQMIWLVLSLSLTSARPVLCTRVVTVLCFVVLVAVMLKGLLAFSNSLFGFNF